MNNKHFLLLTALVLFVLSNLSNHLLDDASKKIVSRFETTLHEKETRLLDEMALLAARSENDSYHDLFINKPEYYQNLYQKEGLVLLIYENDSLKFWSDNAIAVENWRNHICLDTGMTQLNNGWFEVLSHSEQKSNSKSIIGLVLIKHNYPYQNKYLQNNFQHNFDFPEHSKLIINEQKNENAVYNFHDKYLFSIKLASSHNHSDIGTFLSSLFSLLAFAFIIIWTQKISKSLSFRLGRNNSVLLFGLTIFAMRITTIAIRFPESFYELELFSPTIYADASSVFLNSLGDLLINISIVFFVTLYSIQHLNTNDVRKRLSKIKQRKVIPIIVIGLFYIVTYGLFSISTGLIKHSNIPFSINNIFSLNLYSHIAFLIISILFLLSFIFADKSISLLKKLNYTAKESIIPFLIITTLYLCWTLYIDIILTPIIGMPVLLLLIIVFIKQKEKTYTFSDIILLVLCFSMCAVYIIHGYTTIKELETRKIYAQRLEIENDPVAEYLFNDVREKISNDKILQEYIRQGMYKRFENRLHLLYFDGFWSKYDINAALYDETCSPLIDFNNGTLSTTLAFDKTIDSNSIDTESSLLYFVNNVNKVNYISKFNIYKNNDTIDQLGTIYLQFEGKNKRLIRGFPQLLLDKRINTLDELEVYSYAKYSNNELIQQYGQFNYNKNAGGYNQQIKLFSVVNQSGYTHLLYRPDVHTLIVISNPKEGIMDTIATFSYLFAAFTIFLLAIFVLRRFGGDYLFGKLSFKYRIQLLLISILLVSMVLFGGGTIFYINQQFTENNNNSISEKAHSVAIHFKDKVNNENIIKSSLTEYAIFILKQSASIFFTDINLYDTHGNLHASSRSKVFEAGLISKKMNPEAYLQMAVLGKNEFIHNEHIGELEYLSAYIPFKDGNEQVVGYLNLPYFAKQGELKKEISGFLVALINIYVLLFALAVVAAIIISNYVTQPLKLIQDKLSQIKLGKTNELIEWKEKDEIGNLVIEYNRMIIELANSAALLAKSERESAWREMAKQVAHEIKNPLTPMKLSIQHLERIMNDDAPDKDEKIKRLSHTIIEQIDALSTIATEFSNFAKMPKANMEKVDMIQSINTCIDLFADENNIQINFDHSLQEKALVLADKQQLLRVFNNLIKNSIQAIPNDLNGIIDISLEQNENKYITTIKDNGIGINEDTIQNIFTPNFTTKTGGTGLGLAMVKNIVEDMDGKIWFDKVVANGAKFHVELNSWKG